MKSEIKIPRKKAMESFTVRVDETIASLIKKTAKACKCTSADVLRYALSQTLKNTTKES